MSEGFDAAIEVRPLGAPGDLGWVVMAHGEQYAEEFGWGREFEALVARIVADFAHSRVPDAEKAWIATIRDVRVGCVFCVRDDEKTARLRILLVRPEGRGHALGRRLIEECVRFATGAGYERLVLWTNAPLVAARHRYLAAGFRLVDEHPHNSFGVELIGQNYVLDLMQRA